MSTGPEISPAPRVDEDRDEWAWWLRGCSPAISTGRLIRYDKATREELDKEVKLKIDGEDVVIKKAVIATDEQGNPKYDDDGEVIPRPTTIYDAVSRRYEKSESLRV